MRALRVVPIRIFVGVEGPNVRGTASVLFLRKAGYVAAVATDAAARGRGIATHLLEQARRLTELQRRPWLALDVESNHEQAIRLYRKLGYHEVARYAWHVGPVPSSVPSPVDPVFELSRSRRGEVVAWVDQRRPSNVRDALPATRRSLSHLEIFSRPTGTRAKTWTLSATGAGGGVVRAYYSPMVRTGFVIPAAWDPQLPGSSLRGLLGAAAGWIRSVGAVRTVVPVAEPGGPWGPALVDLGLPAVVSTITMVRPSSP